MTEEVPANANEECPGVSSENAGKSDACAGCPNQAACASGKLTKDPAIDQIKKKLGHIKNIILVLSGKGGVGKSTVTSQLALALAGNPDNNVGVLDVDICGPSQPYILGLADCTVHNSNEGWEPVGHHDYQNLSLMSVGFLLPSSRDAVIWRGPKKNGLIKQFLLDVAWGDIDYLIIDCPPGTSDEHISMATYLGELSPKAVIVTTPQEVALLDVRKELDFCRKTNIHIQGVVENMAYFTCPNCACQSAIFPANSGGASAMCQEYGIPLLGQIPINPQIGTTGEEVALHPAFTDIAKLLV